MAALTFAWAAITIFVLKVISGPPKPNMAADPRFVYIRARAESPNTGGAEWMRRRHENFETTRKIPNPITDIHYVYRNNPYCHRGCSRRAAGHMGHRHAQQPDRPTQPCPAVPERHLRGLEAAQRPDPESGGLGQGLHGPRERTPDAHHRPAFARGFGRGERADPRRRRALVAARPAPCRRRELPRIEGQRAVPPPAGADRGDGERAAGHTPHVQCGRDGLQQRHRDVPLVDHRLVGPPYAGGADRDPRP